jgi:quercetin dioxygenase-like cupin family protein
MAADPPVVVARLADLPLKTAQPLIYDRPIALRQLFRGPRTGAGHYLVRYPAGLSAQWHRHTAAHTVVVLEGGLEVNGAVIGPGSYCHLPAGQPMHHAPAAGGSCLFVLLFDGPFDVEPLPEPPSGASADDPLEPPRN